MSDLMQAPRDSELDGLAGAPQAGGQKRVLALVGVAAGVVVLGLAAFFLFFAGGGEESYAPPPKGQPAASDQPGGKNNGKNPVPPVYEGDVGSDPFAPLAAEAVVEPPSAEPSATAAPSGDVALSPDYYQVTIASVDGAQATLVVNGIAYPLTEGARFPDTTTGPFQLVKIASDGKSVTLKYGSETVTVNKNQAYSVKAG